jgi:hypothetical protein
MDMPRFVTDERFERSLARAAANTPIKLAALRAARVKAGDAKALQLFFHTNTPAQAEALAAVLATRGYGVQARANNHPLRWEPTWLDLASWVVAGMTPPLPMDEAPLRAWAEAMAHLGREHDCEFNGWHAPTPDFLEANDDYVLQARADGTLALTLHQWTAASEAALAEHDIYWVTPGWRVPSLDVLAPYAGKIRGLMSPHEDLSLDGIEALAELEQLWLPQTRTTHADYRQLPKLRRFTCLGAEKLDARLLNNPALRHVRLRSPAKLKTLKPFDAWQHLESLVLERAPLASLEGLAHCRTLRELRLANCRSVADIGAIAQVPQLEILEIFNALKLQDCTAIAALSNLHWIALVGMPATLPSLDVVGRWPQVQGATLLLRVEDVALQAVARHPTLAELVAYTHEGFELPAEDTLRAALQADRRSVRSVMLRPKDRHPSFQVTFESPYWRLPGLPAGHARQFVT